MWMTELDPRERRTMAGCFLGWTLDALDVQVYSFVIPTLLVGWHISASQAGVLGTVTLLASAIGGWLSGLLADRFGRVRVLQGTILWYALFTFLCGFAQNYDQLFACRALQGFGFGGEWATGAVLIGEVVRSRYRGRAVGIVQSGWAVGWGLACWSCGCGDTWTSPPCSCNNARHARPTACCARRARPSVGPTSAPR
jgi:MFS family permease